MSIDDHNRMDDDGAPHFDGETYDAERDHRRLSSQLKRVLAFLEARRGEWFTLYQLAAEVGAPEASVSARFRDLKKEKFGQYPVESQRLDGGTWLYRMAPDNGDDHDPDTGGQLW